MQFIDDSLCIFRPSARVTVTLEKIEEFSRVYCYGCKYDSPSQIDHMNGCLEQKTVKVQRFFYLAVFVLHLEMHIVDLDNLYNEIISAVHEAHQAELDEQQAMQIEHDKFHSFNFSL